jgi:hypothetical protein
MPRDPATPHPSPFRNRLLVCVYVSDFCPLRHLVYVASGWVRRLISAVSLLSLSLLVYVYNVGKRARCQTNSTNKCKIILSVSGDLDCRRLLAF